MNFLPSRLTIGEARDLGKRYTCLNELAPLRDESAERVFRRLWELAHKAIHEDPVQEPAQLEDPAKPEAPAMEAEQFIINLLAIDSFPIEDMVTRRPWPSTALYLVHGRRRNPHLLKVTYRRLPYLPLLNLDKSGKGRKLSIIHRQVQETWWFWLLPAQPEVSSFKSHKPRSGWVPLPPLRPCRRGSPSFC